MPVSHRITSFQKYATEALYVYGTEQLESLSHNNVSCRLRTIRQVHCVGTVIGAVLADTPEIAKRAAALVVVGYEELPTVMTIEDAISAERCDRRKWCSIRRLCLWDATSAMGMFL